MKNKLIIFTLTIFAAALIFSATPVSAASCESIDWLEQSTGIKDGLIVPCECTSSDTSDAGDRIDQCGLTELLQTIVNITQLILFLTGTVALVMFMYGGVMFIIAAGAQDKVQKGKDALKAAAIGIVIVLGAWLIVNFTIVSLTGGDVSSPAKIFNQPWTKEPSFYGEFDSKAQQDYYNESGYGDFSD